MKPVTDNPRVLARRIARLDQKVHLSIFGTWSPAQIMRRARLEASLARALGMERVMVPRIRAASWKEKRYVYGCSGGGGDGGHQHGCSPASSVSHRRESLTPPQRESQRIFPLTGLNPSPPLRATCGSIRAIAQRVGRS